MSSATRIHAPRSSNTTSSKRMQQIPAASTETDCNVEQESGQLYTLRVQQRSKHRAITYRSWGTEAIVPSFKIATRDFGGRIDNGIG